MIYELETSSFLSPFFPPRQILVYEDKIKKISEEMFTKQVENSTLQSQSSSLLSQISQLQGSLADLEGFKRKVSGAKLTKNLNTSFIRSFFLAFAF